MTDEINQALSESLVGLNRVIAHSREVFKHVSERNRDEKIFADLDDSIDQTRVKVSETLQKLRTKTAADEISNDLSAERTSNMLIIAQSIIILALIAVSFLIVRRSSNYFSAKIESESSMIGRTGELVEKEAGELERRSVVLTSTVAEQAAGVTETVAAMTEIQSILKRNTESLASASQALSESAESSSVGLRQSHLMAQALTDLNTASSELEKIVDIVNKISTKTEVINAIVFKTQVLAFNASIEAARAGEHGKGFSAVAQEVGRLADISGQAAGEIGTLLDSSKQQVNKILQDVTKNLQTTISVSDQVRSHFEGLAGRVSDVSRSVYDVSMGAKEQLTGIEQCSRAMTEMNAATHSVSQVSLGISEQCQTLRSCVTTIQKSTASLSVIVRGNEAEDHQNLHTDSTFRQLQSQLRGSSDAWQNLPETKQSSTVPSTNGQSANTVKAATAQTEDQRAARILASLRGAANDTQERPNDIRPSVTPHAEESYGEETQEKSGSRKAS